VFQIQRRRQEESACGPWDGLPIVGLPWPECLGLLIVRLLSKTSPRGTSADMKLISSPDGPNGSSQGAGPGGNGGFAGQDDIEEGELAVVYVGLDFPLQFAENSNLNICQRVCARQSQCNHIPWGNITMQPYSMGTQLAPRGYMCVRAPALCVARGRWREFFPSMQKPFPYESIRSQPLAKTKRPLESC
jgi:hypothetical protein